MFHKIFSNFIVFFLLQSIYGYKANSFLNLSSIKNEKELRIANYKLNFLKTEIFHLPFSADDYVIMEDINKVNDIRIKSSYFKNVKVKIGNQIWTLPLNFLQTRRNFCLKFLYAYEADISEVLNDIYYCKNQVKNYKSRFYFLESKSVTNFCSLNG